MTAGARRRHTVVSFHAHPDDEALLTAGTLARTAAEGHRVVLVVATAGESGLTASESHRVPLGVRRRSELERAAAAIGCARIELLDYPDSGWSADGSTRPAPDGFAAADVEEAATRLAAILTQERADILTSYDAAGGYGHPDHVMVHRVGARAAEIAGTPVLLAATVDRAQLSTAVTLLRRLLPPGLRPDIPPLESAYTPTAELTHRIDVTAYLPQKRAAMTAHASQASADMGVRTLAVILRLPRWMFRLALRYEWFVQDGWPSHRPPATDIFASLEAPTAGSVRRSADVGGARPAG